MRRTAAVVAIMALITAPRGLSAQEHAGHSEHVGKGAREIKALSPERVQELLDGAGAGYALPAELNGYPGPRHVLELRDELSLSEAQHERVAAVFEAMRERAGVLGHRLVEAEGELERAFRSGGVTGAELEALTSAAAALEGELRLVHLAAHIETRSLLTPVQVARYDTLRGYADEPVPPREP